MSMANLEQKTRVRYGCFGGTVDRGDQGGGPNETDGSDGDI